jgi:hypothetical protein
MAGAEKAGSMSTCFVAFTRGDRCSDRSAQRSAECSHEAIVAPTDVPTVAPTNNDLSIEKYSRLFVPASYVPF